MSKKRVLFLCKKRNDSYGQSAGLGNSSIFVIDAITKFNIDAKLVTVIDANCIDKEVFNYKPTHVIIEALWVTPAKLEEIVKLHRNVKFIIRIHSQIPFLSNEGIAIEWLYGYQSLSDTYPNIYISTNNFESHQDLWDGQLGNVLLPNIYFRQGDFTPVKKDHNILNIGGFGAIRPLKNQLIQAMAAIKFAKSTNKFMKFHINGNRIEQKGDAIYKNIVSLFANNQYELVQHDWMPHDKFIEVVKTMDIGLQVSFSESFNIVTGDFVHNNVPIVVSDDIEWMPWWTKADTTELDSIVNKLKLCYFGRHFGLQEFNKLNLDNYNKDSLSKWLRFLKRD